MTYAQELKAQFLRKNPELRPAATSIPEAEELIRSICNKSVEKDCLVAYIDDKGSPYIKDALHNLGFLPVSYTLTPCSIEKNRKIYQINLTRL